VVNTIRFDFRAMREKKLKYIRKIMSTLFCGQNLEIDVHLFVDRGSILPPSVWVDGRFLKISITRNFVIVLLSLLLGGKSLFFLESAMA
jgi:hypothetical protein